MRDHAVPPDDVAAVPALLHADNVPADPWPTLQRWVAAHPVSAVVERAGLLDIPAAALGEAYDQVATGPRIRRLGPAAPARAGLLVADLSSMWAGPLCGHLLARAGATVVKVEAPRRPDGTRAGDRAFFDWINGEKLSYCVDFDSQADELRELLAVADIVIEGSRPAALARRRLGPDDVTTRAGRIWLRITGYDGDSGRPAFVDDDAVAGGLVGGSTKDPVFSGDAIADPLTGLEATLAVIEAVGRGAGDLIGVSMAAVAATYAALPTVRKLQPAGPATASPRRRSRRPSSAPTTMPCGAWSPRGRLHADRRATLLDGTVTDIRVGAQIDEVGRQPCRAARGGSTRRGRWHRAAPDCTTTTCTSARRLPRGLVSERSHPGSARKTNWHRYSRMPRPVLTVGAPSATTSRWPGTWNRTALDAVVADIRCGSNTSSGALWILDSAALGRVGLAEHLKGGCAAPTVAGRRRCAARNRPGRTSRRIDRDRRHRRHRRHPRPRRRRHGRADGGAPWG